MFWFVTPPEVGPDVPYTFGLIGKKPLILKVDQLELWFNYMCEFMLLSWLKFVLNLDLASLKKKNCLFVLQFYHL